MKSCNFHNKKIRFLILSHHICGECGMRTSHNVKRGISCYQQVALYPRLKDIFIQATTRIKMSSFTVHIWTQSNLSRRNLNSEVHFHLGPLTSNWFWGTITIKNNVWVALGLLEVCFVNAGLTFYLQGILWTVALDLAVVRELDVKLVDDAWSAQRKQWEHENKYENILL